MEWIVDHPRRVILVCLVLVLGLAAGGSRLSFTNDYRVFFSNENPQLLAFQAIENTYTKTDNVFFVLAPHGGDVFQRPVLQAVQELTTLAWQTPYSTRVDSLSNFQHTYADQDELVVEDLVTDADALGPPDLQRIRAIALSEPLLVDRLVSPEGHVTGINITVQLPGLDETREVPEVVEYTHLIADRIRGEFPGIDVYLTGMVVMDHAFGEASRGDLSTLVPASFAVIVITVGLLLRGWAGTFATLWIILFSILAAMGATGWLAMRITPPSATAPTIIMTLAVADTVHILASMVHYMHKGMPKREALLESLRINMQPVFLTSLTTGLGFLSMNFSDAPPFRDLGNITTMGVTAAYLLSITFLPALVMLLPIHARQQPEGSRLIERFAGFVVHRHRTLLWSVGAIIAMLIAFIPRNELNDVFVNYFNESIEFRRHTDFVDRNLGGLYNIQYSLPAAESGGVSRPDYLAQVDRFAAWLRGQPEVVHVNTFTDTMKRLNKNLHGDDPDWYRLPDQRDLAAQYLLLYEMSLPYGLDLNDQINVDKSASRMSVTTRTLSTNDFLALVERADTWLKRNTPGIYVEASSTSVMFGHIGQRNIESMLVGTTVALVLISMVLIIALRSFKLGMISLLPNLLPAGMAFGLWGLLVGEVGLSLSVVTAMSLGIVVDDTVHFLSKYLRARREQGLDPEAAVRYAFSSVGMALWITSLVLMAGFMVLALSAFYLNAGMGMLTAIVIGLALVVDFLFLPPLLMKLDADIDEKPVDRAAAGTAGT